MKLRISIKEISLVVDLADTPTAKAILQQVPFDSTAQTWGEEVYFSTPLPFGRTPISTDQRPKLANPCNVLGKIENFKLLKSVKPGDKITVTKA